MYSNFENILDDMYPNLPLVDNIKDSTGYDDIDELIEDITYDTEEPVGVCTSCGEVSDLPIEPDGKNYLCEFCGHKTLTSLQVILGLI